MSPNNQEMETYDVQAGDAGRGAEVLEDGEHGVHLSVEWNRAEGLNKMPRDVTHQAMTIRAVADELAIADVQVEHRRDTRGIGTPLPRLSWMITTTIQG